MTNVTKTKSDILGDQQKSRRPLQHNDSSQSSYCATTAKEVIRRSVLPTGITEEQFVWSPPVVVT